MVVCYIRKKKRIKPLIKLLKDLRLNRKNIQIIKARLIMKELKIGMVGLDTSHCGAFTEILHNESLAYYIPGAKIAGAFPGGSNLTAFSSGRVESITAQMRDERGIKIYDSIEEMAEGMDAFFLESVDGRQHLEQFEILAEYGKPVFIDKPFACSFCDAKEIADLAKKKNVPIMTASAIRYAAGIENLHNDSDEIRSCEAFGPMVLPDDYPEYFWYGIHSAELLYSFMGQGCKSIQAVHQENTDLLIGEWQDGRIGILRGLRYEGVGFGCTLHTDKGVKTELALSDPPYYAQMMKYIIPFFQSGKSPIDIEESLEVIAFLDAATQSREKGGEKVSL